MSESENSGFKPTCTSQIVQNLVVSSGFANRSQIGLIRDAFCAIEEAHNDGFSYKTIEQELARCGIQITTGSLKNIMRRIRNERKKAKIREPTQQRPPGVVPPRPVTGEPTPQTARQRRDALGKKYAPDESPASKNPLLKAILKE